MAELPVRLIMQQLFTQGGNLKHIPWEFFRKGVDIHRLYGGGPDTASAALLRYAPGAGIPTHDHVGYEHILVLEGAQQDEHGYYAAGTLLINGPGSRHTVFSEQGCVVLAIWEKPVNLSI